ncbi:phosphatase PAP2 family protein [Clostridia bacterium]|nr:phosphatase PAP2 family protein [Clostridia bacterium]
MFEKFLTFDKAFFQWIYDNFSPGDGGVADGFFKFITRLGDKGLFWIVLAVVLMVPKQTRKPAIIMAIALVFDVILVNGILKHVFARERPFDFDWGTFNYFYPDLVKRPEDFSFPSGHTAASFAGAVAFILGLRSKWIDDTKKPNLLTLRILGVVGIILAFLIGFSRIYIGVHYASDVIGGVVIGIICAVLAFFTFSFIEPVVFKKIQKK